MDPAERIASITAELVAIPSHEREEDVQRAIAAQLEACGFACRLEEVEPGRPNLVAVRGTGGTFFCSHADTHPPHSHPEPFTCRRRGDLLVGRGVLDVKGQIAALLTALADVPQAPACVAITCDEEFLGLGSEHLRVPDGPWWRDGGIVLEPTDLRVCVAQTGHIDLRVEASADSGHVYGERAAASPIDAVVDAADALRACAFLRTAHPLLPGPRVRIGRIAGGEHLWRHPSRAWIEIAIGLVPGIAVNDAVAEVREVLDAHAERWGSRALSVLYDVVDASEAIEVPADLPVAGRIAEALGERLEPAGMSSWTDAGNLLVRHGLPCVVFGAGELAPAHSDHEWVSLADLVRLATVLRSLLEAA